MARYKAIDTSPRFLAVDLEKQLCPPRQDRLLGAAAATSADCSARTFIDVAQRVANRTCAALRAGPVERRVGPAFHHCFETTFSRFKTLLP